MVRDRDESNLYTYGVSPVSGVHGRGRVGGRGSSLRSARVWAAVGILWALIWFWGFGSLVAIATGMYSWVEYRSVGRRPILALISITLGLLGLLLAGYWQFS